MTFAALPLAEPIQRALAGRGYETPSPIQAQAIPPLIEGRDLLGCAQTGTGKTAAFCLPILHRLQENNRRPKAKSARVLILTPTRELATQVGKSMEAYGEFLNIKTALVFGGVGQGPQVRALRPGVDVLVACPGRLEDLIDQGHVTLSGVEFIVLDEADRMLDMGFVKPVKRIVAQVPKQRQSLFFSATMAPSVRELANSILKDPVSVTIEPEVKTSESVSQRVCFIKREDKRSLLKELLEELPEGELAIVFGRTKYGSDKLARWITQQGIKAEAIHGNRSQSQRDKTLDRFRAGKVPVLVATDVAARGVDVKAVTLVINFDLPNEPDAYVHRIGRTGRAEATGHAVSFCSEEEVEYLRDIERLIEMSLPIDTEQAYHEPNYAADLAQMHSRGQQGKKGRRSGGGGNRRGGGGQRRGNGGGNHRNQGGGNRNQGGGERRGNNQNRSSNRRRRAKV
ncbi:MAG: DEAD/DEAH box helicase [Verrucomicrobiota bacterium JB023]|nr:DEAD/DEAH box helicase [Verrucomicrobiota bacterium JB023]